MVRDEDDFFIEGQNRILFFFEGQIRIRAITTTILHSLKLNFEEGKNSRISEI